MPRHRSLGVGATLLDTEGNPLICFRSPHTERVHGMFTSSYCIYGRKPKMAGQAPDASGWYLWYTCSRAPFTNTGKYTNSSGQLCFASGLYMGYVGDGIGSMRYALKTATEQGYMITSGLKGEKPPRHNIQCAQGADPILAICLLYAKNLVDDEIDHTSNH